MKNEISRASWWKVGSILVIVTLGILVAFTIYSVADAGGKLPPAKQIYENRYQQFQQNALTGVRPAKDPGNGQPIINNANSVADTSWPTGIFDTGQAPFPSDTYIFNNQWQQIINGYYVNVYAGVLGTDPMQGVLVMVTRPDPNSNGTVTVYLTSTKTGSLRITHAEDSLLEIVAANGSKYNFNAVKGVLVQTK